MSVTRTEKVVRDGGSLENDRPRKCTRGMYSSATGQGRCEHTEKKAPSRKRTCRKEEVMQLLTQPVNSADGEELPFLPDSGDRRRTHDADDPRPGRYKTPSSLRWGSALLVSLN